MKAANLILPNQLFEDFHLPAENDCYIVEEYLFFKQYKFHKQKIAFHRASLKFYASFLKNKNINVHYIESSDERSDIRVLIDSLSSNEYTHVNTYYSEDYLLSKRITKQSLENNLQINWFDNQLFINTTLENSKQFNPNNKKFHQTTFYKNQRKKLKILVDHDNKPEGGKWTFDSENRKKYPKNLTPPETKFLSNDFFSEAVNYTLTNFSDNPGEISPNKSYPVTFNESKKWFEDFLLHKFYDFGVYEDAIVKEEIFLNHSIISPILNNGLLNPGYVIDRSLEFSSQHNIPLNSTEGFIRQVIGWREFIRGIYNCKGSMQRTTNFWGFSREIPQSFYDGTTGIDPIDDSIKKVLKTGYCHHIERLMILSNFMMLCEFSPDSVYRWFMELFIDAYDWVMVPNVYGMSLYADGGLMTTKPYISSSNYIFKMSNYSKGPWQEIWDALFWRFMNTHRDFFLKNPRLSMLVRTFDKWDTTKKDKLMTTANNYLKELS